MTNTVNLARTAADKKKEKDRWSDEKSIDHIEDYPYGLELSLDNSTIEKLKMQDLESDDEVYIVAKAKVTSSTSRSVGGKTERSAGLQITDMALSKSEDAESALYSKEK
jgi:uncharacterized protein (DUF2249 family)